MDEDEDYTCDLTEEELFELTEVGNICFLSPLVLSK